MKLLFATRACALGGVAMQLFSRVRYLASVPGVEIDLAFQEERGAKAMLEKHGRVSIVDPWRFREMVARGEHAAIVVADAPAYLEAVADLSEQRCLVVEIHSVEPSEVAHLEARKFSCDSFVVPSRYSKRMLRDRGYLGPYDPIEITPNIVDPKVFFPSPGGENPRPIVGWVGHLDDQKDWKRFLLMGSLLVEAGRDVELWMVGGERADDATVEAFVESVDGLDLSDRVRWFPRIEHPAMRRFYSGLAVSGGCLLSTSRAESFGVSIAEALLSGCPVVAPDAGAIAEVAPGAPYLSLYDEIEGGVTAIEAFLGTAELRARLEEDLDELRSRFSPETLGPRYLAMLVRLIEARRLRSEYQDRG